MAHGDDFKYHSHLKNNSTTITKCKKEHPHRIIRKLVRLLETTVPEHQLNRKQVLLNDFLSACLDGFWIRDIPFVSRIVELILENEKLLLYFQEPLEKILRLFTVPPMLTCSSEVLNCKRDLVEYFNFLAYLMMYNTNRKYIKDLALKALWCLLDKYPSPGKRYISLELRREAVGESIIADVIAEMLPVASEEDYSVLLKLAVLLSQVSEDTGFTFITNGAINVAMLRLEPNWYIRNQNFPPSDFISPDIILNCDIALKFLWILLRSLKNCSTEFLKKIKPVDLQSLWSFQYTFQILVKTKLYEVERNHCLAILLLCLKYLPRSAFMQSGLICVLAKVSAYTQITLGEDEIYLTSTDVDFQFKKMAIMTLYFTADNFSALSVYHDFHVIKHLMDSIMPEANVIWIKEQQKKLVIITLGVLPKFLPDLKDDFLEYEVLSSVRILIQYYFYNSYDAEILLALLKCLYFILFFLPQETNYMIENLVTDLTVYFSTQQQLLSVHNKCLNFCLSILLILTENQNSQNILMVNTSADYMKRVLNPTSDDFPFDPTTMICLFDLLWNGLLTNEANLKCFVKSGSVYALIDLIEKGIFPVKLVGLGLLTDLCEEGSCIPHLLTWRSKGKTLISLLMSIFRKECRMTRVKIDENGIIGDVEFPIMGVRQYEATKPHNKNLNSSPATVDFILSVRPKIYAILQLLKYRHKETVELVNDHYKLQNQPLSPKDQVTKLVAENYFQFKFGEVWCEINIDLQNMGLKPLCVDGRTIETLIRKHYHLSMKIKEIQEEVLKRKFEEDKVNEYLVYKMLKESKLCSALCALKELDYMARVSEHMIRHLKKSIQKQQIEDSLALVKDGIIHRTFMHNIGVTNVFGLRANVKSDINEKEKSSNGKSRLPSVLPELSADNVEVS